MAHATTRAAPARRRHEKYERLVAAAQALPRLKVAVAHPCDGAADLGLIEPILVGPRERILAAAAALATQDPRDPARRRIVEAGHSHVSAAAAVALVNTGAAEAALLHVAAWLRAHAATDSGAREAIDLFVYRIGRELGGIDGLVFTGGIGENDAATRAEVLRGAAWAGFRLDEAANAAGGPLITRGPGPQAFVIPTDEEAMIARGMRGARAGIPAGAVRNGD